uniref:hypothetical protein n=1 Tax=Agathobacter sp. TaxID=2021311 RepID=UPI004055C50A
MEVFENRKAGSISQIESHKLINSDIVMENCRYITTDFYKGAAINKNGELYTWGWNILGACGTEITEDELFCNSVQWSIVLES